MNYSLGKLGIEHLNAMQQDMLHLYRRHKSIVLLSPTGSGKTLSYMLPLLESIKIQTDAPQALVLVPSRELAQQTLSVLKALTGEVRATACYGGRATMDEHRILRQVQPSVIIGTPGRILDHIQKSNFQTEEIHILVIDEFDKCLEQGFHAQMSAILASLPAVQKRVLLSATDCPSIPDFLETGDVCRLDYLIPSEQVPDRIELRFVRSPQKDKLETLLGLLCILGQQKSLVFVNYRESAERVGHFLHDKGVSADVFHGGMEQRDRERALFRFQNGSCNVLVSTDLASRGLDITHTDNIIHYHLPLNEEAYVHRNGRTARWDAQGCSYLLLGPEENVPDYIQDVPDEFFLPKCLPAPAEPKWITLYIGRGRRNKVNRVDVLGFLTKVGGLNSQQVGRIDVMPDWAFVAVERSVVPSLMERLKGQKIKGQKTIVCPARL